MYKQKKEGGGPGGGPILGPVLKSLHRGPGGGADLLEPPPPNPPVRFW